MKRFCFSVGRQVQSNGFPGHPGEVNGTVTHLIIAHQNAFCFPYIDATSKGCSHFRFGISNLTTIPK